MSAPSIPPTVDTSGLLAAGVILSLFTASVVSVRLAAGLHTTGKLNLDDYISVLATALLVATFAVFLVLIEQQNDPAFYTALDPRPAIRRLAQYAESEIFLSGFSMWTAKLPVLLLLARIFGVDRAVRITAYATALVLGIAIVSAGIYNAVICWPPGADDGLDVYLGFVPRCTDASSLTGTILAPISLAGDVIIFLLPLPVIFKLQLSIQKKIGLLVVFLFGLVAIAVTAVSTKFKFDSRSGKTTDVQLAMILTLFETTIVLAAGCVPAFKTFWATIIVKSGWYSRLSSLLSSGSRREKTARARTRSNKHGASSQDSTSSSHHGSSKSHRRDIHRDSASVNQYYQLEDQAPSTRKLVAETEVRRVGHEPQPWR